MNNDDLIKYYNPRPANFTRVVIESPFSGDVEGNRIFALACMKFCLDREEAPMVPHLLYPRVLTKYNLAEREKGIQAGLSWVPVAQKSVVFTNKGLTQGMIRGIAKAEACGIEVERIHLPGW